LEKGTFLRASFARRAKRKIRRAEPRTRGRKDVERRRRNEEEETEGENERERVATMKIRNVQTIK